jgi:hypothetical protein
MNAVGQECNAYYCRQDSTNGVWLDLAADLPNDPDCQESQAPEDEKVRHRSIDQM